MSFGHNPFNRMTPADHVKAREIADLIEKHVGRYKAPQFAQLVSTMISEDRMIDEPNLCSEIMLPNWNTASADEIVADICSVIEKLP